MAAISAFVGTVRSPGGVIKGCGKSQLESILYYCTTVAEKDPSISSLKV